MGKQAFIVRRLAQSLITLLALMTLTFFIFRLMPGDPVTILISEGRLDPQAQARIREQFGLDQPIYIQYMHYLRNLLTGNFGMSFFYNRGVGEIIRESLVNSLVLVLPSMSMAILVGVIVGSILGWYRGRKVEVAGVVIALFLQSLPVFWLAILILMIFSYKLNWFPTGSMFTPGPIADGISKFLSKDFIHHLALPFATSFLIYVSAPLLLMRNSMLDTKGEDFLQFLKAKGVKEITLIQHGFRNGLLPVVTYIAVMSSYVIEGNVLLEVVFSWPGMGRELVDAVIRRDFPVAQGAFFVMGLVLIIMNLLADLLYGYLDPRVTYK